MEESENSTILLPTKPKVELDLDTVDKLAFSNKNFKEFLRNIAENIKIGKVNMIAREWESPILKAFSLMTILPVKPLRTYILIHILVAIHGKNE